MNKEVTASKKNNNAGLLLGFLRGSKALFIMSIICSAVTTLVDMMNPQIIRGTIDNAVGGKVFLTG